MKKIKILICLLIATCSQMSFSQNSIPTVLKSKKGDWSVTVNSQGAITELVMQFKGSAVKIPWRTDENGGPAWKGIALSQDKGNQLRFEGKNDAQIYSLEYRDIDGKLTVIANLKNEDSRPFQATQPVRLTLGIDNEMKDPKTFFGYFFPTLLRCEKTHFWGYFQNPNGQILTISSPDPVASRQIEYIANGHRITTSSLDLMHQLPLPLRHPQQLIELAAGESRSWSIVLQPASTLEEVLPIIATNCKAPAIGLDRTTAAVGETIEISVNYHKISIPTLTLLDPASKLIILPKPVLKNNLMRFTLVAPKVVGNYTIKAISNGKQTEALFHIRKPWAYYLNQARTEALRMQIKPMQHREGWLSFFSAYLAQSYFPDTKQLAETEKIFHSFYSLMVDSTTADFYLNKPTWNTRPQNTSWMVGMLVARYNATAKIQDLELAAQWGDLLIKKFQLPNGAYKGYTALTLGAKFLSELAWAEKPFIEKDTVWKNRFERHLRSVEAASQNILKVKDLGDTEGESTYEDTQAGSAWSLMAMYALKSKEDSIRKQFIETSMEVQQRHECLTQALIPDGRMRGGTLRFWESQYDVLTTPNMMNSPHGWTMRSQFGAFYLYQLTGEEKYLNIMNNAMGSCAQAIDEKTGILRWAFVPDPYIEASQFVPDAEKPGQGKRVPVIIGEQWLPMISDWWRVPEGQIGGLTVHKADGLHKVTQGWSCDNDVHEHFIILAEQFISNAFVLEREDGSLRTMNCQVLRTGNKLTVKLPEKVISRVHFNLKSDYNIVIPFATKTIKQSLKKGMHWIESDIKSTNASDFYIVN